MQKLFLLDVLIIFGKFIFNKQDGNPVYLYALEHRYYGESYPSKFQTPNNL